MYLTTIVSGFNLGDLELRVRTPASLSEVKEAECPVCLVGGERRPQDWALFACGHSTCMKCMWQLLATAKVDAVGHAPPGCPICRRPLLMPREGAVPVAPPAAEAGGAGTAPAGEAPDSTDGGGGGGSGPAAAPRPPVTVPPLDGMGLRSF